MKWHIGIGAIVFATLLVVSQVTPHDTTQETILMPLLQQLDDIHKDINKSITQMQTLKSSQESLNQIILQQQKEIQSLHAQLHKFNQTLRELEHVINTTAQRTEFKLMELEQIIEHTNENTNLVLRKISNNKNQTLPIEEKDIYKNGTAFTNLDIKEKLKEIFPKAKIITSDIVYITPPIENIDKLEIFINWTKIPELEYKAELNDCDDFAWRLYSESKTHYSLLALGVAYSKNHVFNIIIFKINSTNQLSVYIIEPQTGSIFPFNETLPEYYREIEYVFL
ncbi:hypothetical protein [Thermococcus barophilus]|uniref:Uncharacterized protein n=1 Tax=Thermococcus barophilus (strain DSM 11836 / MP) TaxID=391623 RepID=F0LN85_THEBM|nr:hypothetical protein [Thermococcus barophilus]ADT85224.1 hypothetical protein TERMP_02251 [Thermococcus barophilus MP]